MKNFNNYLRKMFEKNGAVVAYKFKDKTCSPTFILVSDSERILIKIKNKIKKLWGYNGSIYNPKDSKSAVCVLLYYQKAFITKLFRIIYFNEIKMDRRYNHFKKIVDCINKK